MSEYQFRNQTGSVIYLHSYLSTMFQISDVLVDKEEVAMIPLMHREFPAFSARNPYISYILYQTSAGKSIYPIYRRL